MGQTKPVPHSPTWRVATLTEPSCVDPAFAGPDLAALARLRDGLLVPPTVLAVSTPDLWLAPETVDPMLREVRRLLGPFSVATTVRGWLMPSGVPIGPVWFNIGAAAVEEAAIELAGIAAREMGTDGSARLAVAVQMFVPPDVSVLASVETTEGRVRLRSCWGIDEDLGAGVWYDTMLIGERAGVEDHHVVPKPTATAPAGGGTQTVDIAPSLRGKPSLPAADAVPIAQACLRMAQRLGTAAEFELSIAGTSTYLLGCHPR